MSRAVVFRTIKPKKATLDVGAMTAEMKRIGTEVGEEVLLDYRETTRTWSAKNKPDFHLTVESREDAILIDVWTMDQLYGWLDEGTPPHIIRPVNGKVLCFQSGYSAKTTPKVIGSGPGGAYGEKVFATVVYHPGTEAREWSQEIQKKWQKRLYDRVRYGMKRVAKASGHGI